MVKVKATQRRIIPIVELVRLPVDVESSPAADMGDSGRSDRSLSLKLPRV